MLEFMWLWYLNVVFFFMWCVQCWLYVGFWVAVQNFEVTKKLIFFSPEFLRFLLFAKWLKLRGSTCKCYYATIFSCFTDTCIYHEPYCSVLWMLIMHSAYVFFCSKQVLICAWSLVFPKKGNVWCKQFCDKNMFLNIPYHFHLLKQST